ncbi:LysR family transcriptional regulator [Oecophyllibacter saccharovorans]|uniref:LysR family transcriptional regulator n=1 Tax=Oecophyllibacter saccharovorans TaxID=2558360 RepID=UPI0011418CBF|nr:LysR family transcriptional regulator [Oecophyllibacter saccharovorans]QDH14658.1 LysR family transcriptional regulator [Oecophyllibacter saccharovorans]
MNIHHFRYFVAVAETGSFTLAAERLNMKQPPLSQQVKRMEDMLGIQLFLRQTRGVVLTAAGEALLPRARLILDLERQFVETARGLAQGVEGHLRIGLAGAAPLVPIIPYAIRRFRKLVPHVTLSLEESNTPTLCDMLQAHNVDIAILRPPVIDPSHLQLRPFLEEPTLIALPAGRPYGQEETLSLQQIAHEPLIIFPRELGPGFYDAILSAYHQVGLSPNLGQQAPQISGTVPLVAAGLGISIVPNSLRQLHTGGVTFHKIAPPAPIATLAIGLRRGPVSPLVEKFCTVLQTVAKTIPMETLLP